MEGYRGSEALSMTQTTPQNVGTIRALADSASAMLGTDSVLLRHLPAWIPMVVALAIVSSACDSDDIGKPCPQLGVGEEDATSADGSRLETQEVVGVDVSFPCEEFICIATDGRAGYCSKKCRNDAGCPDGFSCREIQRTGDFAGEKFCAWKRCEKASDCGNIDEFCCQDVDTQGIEELKLCGFENDDALCP